MRITILTAFAAAMMLMGAQPALAQTGHDLFQQALVMERANGELRDAITLYERIVGEFADDRELVARALVQMGRCYEKLGLTDAREVYRRVIDNFPEQRSEVAIARERLASLAEELAELRRQPTFRKVQIASSPQSGVLSADGNKLAFVSDGHVWIVPLHGNVNPDIAGEPSRIAAAPGAWDYYGQMAWSADGRWIAVNAGGAGENAAFVFPASGGDPREIRLPPRRGHYQSNRLSVSPDGQTVVFSALELGSEQESESYIYAVPTAGGEPRQMAWIPSSLPAFSPDGKFIAFVGYQKSDTEEGGSDADLWVVPSSGGTPIRLTNGVGKLRGPVWSPDGKYIAVNHEPLGGNPSDEIWVYTLSPDVSSASEPTKIVLPRETYHILAGWTPENELGVFIDSETRTAIYTVPASGGRALQVTPERGGPYYPRWSPDGERIYLRWFFREGESDRLRDKFDGYERTVSVPATGGEFVTIPGQSEWGLGIVIPGGGLNVSPDGERIVVGAAHGRSWTPQDGHDLWTFRVDGGRPIRLTSDASSEAYPCWSPDGRWIAFTDIHETSEGEGYRGIYLIPAEGGRIRQVTTAVDSVGGGAIAFSPDGRRIAFFSGDAIKAIRVQGGNPEELVSGIESGRHSQLAWSPDGSKIAHDVGGKIWITQLDRGVPEELRTGLPEGAWIGDFSWSPAGEKIAFVGEIGGDAEFWLISDFLP